MRKSVLLASIIWMLLTGLSFTMSRYRNLQSRNLISLQTARSFFNQIVLTREWNARHGGVYVPVTDETQPNPYLKVPDRDLVIRSDLTLTKVNPAFMTRQIGEIAAGREGIRFHITSLNPIRPENAPTPREKEALLRFEEGLSETAETLLSDPDTSFFYMAPLFTEESCLSCHEEQGYEVGDIHGGISVMFPLPRESSLSFLLLGHLILGAAGLGGIHWAGRHLNRAYDTIKEQAVIDTLTGIPNRRSFTERVLQEYDRSNRNRLPLALIMGDIDFFKKFNDTYGHMEGDRCLRRVAQTISGTLKRPGDFCARYGGEEFIILLPETAIEGAAALAEVIRRNVQDENIPHSGNLPAGMVTISLGVAAIAPEQVKSYEELLHLADTALYDAKNRGRNRVEIKTGPE